MKDNGQPSTSSQFDCTNLTSCTTSPVYCVLYTEYCAMQEVINLAIGENLKHLYIHTI